MSQEKEEEAPDIRGMVSDAWQDFAVEKVFGAPGETFRTQSKAVYQVQFDGSVRRVGSKLESKRVSIFSRAFMWLTSKK